MDRKKIPLAIIKIIEPLLEENKDLVEVIEKEDVFYYIKDKESDLFFIIQSLTHTDRVAILVKPANEFSTNKSNINPTINQIGSYFTDWINLIKQYNIHTTKNLLIDDLIDLIIKSIAILQSMYSSFPKGNEAQYNRIIAKGLNIQVKDKNAPIIVIEDELIDLENSKFRADVTIKDRNSENTLLLIECVMQRGRLPKGQIANKIRHIFDVDTIAKPLHNCHIVYYKEGNFNSYVLEYITFLDKIVSPIPLYSVVDITDKFNTENIKIIESTYQVGAESKKIYHFIVDFTNAKLLSKSNNNENRRITPTKINKLNIKCFKLINNLTININQNTNIFLGSNGFGKTSILQALALSNIPDLNEDKDSDFIDFITHNEKEATFLINRGDENIEIETLLDIYKKSTQISDVEFEPIFLAYGTNTFTRYTDHNYDEIVKEIINGTEKWYHTKSLFQDYSDFFYDPLGVLNKLSEFEFYDIEKKGEVAGQIKTLLLNTLNKLIPNFQIEKDPNGTAYYFFNQKGEKQKLKLQQLSEGYRANIILLTDILIRVISLRNEVTKIDSEVTLENIFTVAKGIIAIDEFDRHLHPSWQRKFVNDLLTTLPNIQFFLTTHNPMSVLDREEGEVHQLVFDENGQLIVRQHKGGTKNMDVVMTLLNYFEIDSTVSQSLQNKIDLYYDLLAENPHSQEVKQLEEELKNAYVGIPIHDFRYLKFLQFIKAKGVDIRDKRQIESFDFSEEEWGELAKEIAEIQ